jgi:hypothetical protein
VDTNPHTFCAPGIIQTNNTAFLPYGASTTNKRVDSVMKLTNTILRVSTMVSLATKLMNATLRGLTMLLLANELMDAILRVLTMLLLVTKLMDAILRGLTTLLLVNELMNAILRILMHRAMILSVSSMRVRSVCWTSSMKPAYRYGCRLRGLPSLGLMVRAHARGVHPPFFKGGACAPLWGSSFGRVSKRSEEKCFEGKKGEGKRRQREKKKRQGKDQEQGRKKKRAKVSDM